ncbi:hypothetical protein [Methanolapillus millepedarum]|uniref:Uncharacterized protein n=1 Tax=Methanolapillus millepedarum TaxID=3028296 RepID=A0AA97A2X3_9EURY|nr:hypothetical protein MsAc7_00100 [Methanosarcinaceae archaeon Ac7]
MKKSEISKKTEELEEVPVVDYSNLPDEFKNEFLNEKPYVIEKFSKLSWDGKQFSIRIPKEITDEMDITKRNQIKFKMTKARPGMDEKNVLEISLVIVDGS